MSLEMWSAWLDASGAVLHERGGPAAQKVLEGLFDPETWRQGSWSHLMEEVRELWMLPRFADLPGLDAEALPSPGPALELAAVAQHYMRVAVPLWVEACRRFQARAAERGAQGARLDSAGETLDLWNEILDRTLMEFNRSAEFGELQQRFLRAAMRQRLEVRKFMERAARMVDLPTRTELDDVYRRLHDLRREVHELRRELRAVRAANAAAAPGPGRMQPDAAGKRRA
jgi:hypothetical protein